MWELWVYNGQIRPFSWSCQISLLCYWRCRYSHSSIHRCLLSAWWPQTRKQGFLLIPVRDFVLFQFSSFLHHNGIGLSSELFRTGHFVGISSTAHLQSPDSIFNLFPLLHETTTLRMIRSDSRTDWRHTN